MPAWTQDELLLFLLFFVPGFISIKVYDLLVPTERRPFQNTLAEAIAYSAVNFAILLPVIIAALAYGVRAGLWSQLAVSYVVLLFAPLFGLGCSFVSSNHGSRSSSSILLQSLGMWFSATRWRDGSLSI